MLPFQPHLHQQSVRFQFPSQSNSLRISGTKYSSNGNLQSINLAKCNIKATSIYLIFTLEFNDYYKNIYALTKSVCQALDGRVNLESNFNQIQATSERNIYE